MKAEITKVELVTPAKLLPGTYAGIWSGYVIELEGVNQKWVLHMKDGMRGRVSVHVEVDDAGNMEVIIPGQPT